MRSLLWISVAAALVVCSGCATTHRSQSPTSQPATVIVQKPAPKHGPPAHAPAHGYRRHQAADDVDLVYDAQMRAYVVAGYPNHYYDDGVYFRWTERGWEMSATLSGKWGQITVERVPKGIRGQHP